MRVRFVNNSNGEAYSIPLALFLFACLLTAIVLSVNNSQTILVVTLGVNGLTACFAAYIAHAYARPSSGIDPVQFAAMLELQDRIRGSQLATEGKMSSLVEHVISLSRQPRMLPGTDEDMSEAIEILSQARLLVEDWQEHADPSGCYTVTPSQMHELLALVAMADSLLPRPSEQLDAEAS